jgi:hypothetical protein
MAGVLDLVEASWERRSKTGTPSVGGEQKPGRAIRQDGPVNEFLVVYLDSIDDRLLDYLDDDEELKLDTVKRLRFYTTAMLDGSITPTALHEDWPDWFDLAPAFAAAYAPEDVEELEEAPALLEGPGDGAPLTAPDQVSLRALEPLLDMYPEMRATDQD